jgi:Tfp pilus assembly protein PilN
MKAVNLLPQDTRGAVKTTSERTVVDESNGFGAYAVLGALALAALGLAGVVLTGNAIKDREAELASLKTQTQQLTARTSALRPYADFDQMASARVATITDLAGRRFDWEQAIRDLSRAVPANVTLSELTGNVSTDAGGTGGSALRGAIAAPAITLTGCTTDQPSVARLMARLRTIDGVTRVSLSKSEKSNAAQSSGAGVAAPAPGASSGSGAPCGEGKRPEFEMVMFFEGDADATAAPSASPPAAGSAAAGTTTANGQPAAPANGQPSTPANGQQTGSQSTPASTGAAQPAATPTTQGGVTP